MKIIEPLAMTDAQLTASSVTENDAPVWNVATAYAVDDPVISLTTHSVYVCEIANTGVDPDTDVADPPNWTRLGATNRWKAFDTLISDPVADASPVSYTITPAQVIAGIAFFGLAADAIKITVSLGATTIVYETDLIDLDEVEGWYSWLFSGVQREEEALFMDIPYLGAGTEYLIEITGSGTLGVGQIVLGKVTDLGITQWGSEIGIIDFSRKENDVYGNALILERRFARLANFPIGIPSTRARRVQRTMEEFRAKPVVWVGDSRPEFALIIYGFYQSYTHVLELEGWSKAIIEVEGLV